MKRFCYLLIYVVLFYKITVSFSEIVLRTEDSNNAEPAEEIVETGGASGNEIRGKLVDFLLDEIGITFVSIPEGSFKMGFNMTSTSDSVEVSSDVTIDSFEISATEITNAQYCSFLNAVLTTGDIAAAGNFVIGITGEYSGKEYLNFAGNFDSENKSWIRYNRSVFSVDEGKNNRPVVYVTWYGAMAFALNYGLDLPTEAEWEYAASAGGQYQYGTNDGKISTSKANYGRVAGYPVDGGSYPPNPFGLYDMCGNVWEWCSDWYDEEYYISRPENNPAGPDFGFKRVIRGGSWYSPGTSCQAAFTTAFEPGFKYHSIGFRVVRRRKTE